MLLGCKVSILKLQITTPLSTMLPFEVSRNPHEHVDVLHDEVSPPNLTEPPDEPSTENKVVPPINGSPPLFFIAPEKKSKPVSVSYIVLKDGSTAVAPLKLKVLYA